MNALAGLDRKGIVSTVFDMLGRENVHHAAVLPG
jgi:hypothetical protein